MLKPLSLWELGVSRFGVFPEMQTFGLRLMREDGREHPEAAIASTSSSTTSASPGDLLGLQAMGVPVVSVIHHPLHIDREADFTIESVPGRSASSERSTSRC